MKFKEKRFASLFIIFMCLTISAQQKKPKVALVLSGGGAKGIAHIPTLQALDSLGIVPDIIIGTSMGSIVGGLYASGYSGDSIASISKHTDWGKLFSSKVPVTAVSNQEKDEFKRYLLEIELGKGIVNKTTSIVSDQNIKAFFNKLTYPVNNIKDFDKLPIPFRAITTDIVNGKEIILDKGSLSFAMRSSMSIPAIFTPMEYKDVLLIDGGVLNNFPTDIAKEWGADIIIGSDVGGGMEPKEKLSSPVTIIFQSAMLASNLKVPANKKLCDVLIDHTQHLSYSTGSFGKTTEIFKEGQIATKKNLTNLVVVANRLKKYNQKKVALPFVAEHVILDTIIYKGISENNMALFQSRINIEKGIPYTLEQINDASESALGTNLFDTVSFHLFRNGNKLGLKVTAREKSPHLFKSSLHFDDSKGIGLLLNYTGRNIIGNSSRILLSIDITNDFSYRAQYQNNFGKTKNFWFRSELFGEKIDQRSYVEGKYGTDLESHHLQFENQINLNIDSFKNYIGLGISGDWNHIEPKIDPEIHENIYYLKNYYFNTIDIYFHYEHNTLDQIFYPKKGTYFRTKLSTSLKNDMMVEYSDNSVKPKAIGSVNPFTKIRYNFEKRIPINNNLSTILGISAGYSFYNEHNNELDFSYYGYAAHYFLGGNIVRPRLDTFVTNGLNENELAATQFSMLNIAFQYTPLSKIYLKPHATIASVGFGKFNNYLSDFLQPTGNWINFNKTSLLTTIGFTASYSSIIGPVDLDISWTNKIRKPRYYLGIGYHFNP